MNNGAGDNTTIILVVGVCFSCLLSIGFLVIAHYQGWLDNIYAWFEDDGEDTATQAPNPDPDPGVETPPNNTDNNSNNNTDNNDNNNNEDDNEDDNDKCQPDDPDKQCKNKSGNHHVCPVPWNRGFLKYSTNGMGKRCCKDKNSKYDSSNCKNEAITVPDGFPTDVVHKEVTKRLSGRIMGPLKLGQCPDGKGGSKDTILYQERNASGQIKQTWCHPKNDQKAYALYPMCYNKSGGGYATDGTKVKKNSRTDCTNGTKIKWEDYTKAGGSKRHRYVNGGDT